MVGMKATSLLLYNYVHLLCENVTSLINCCPFNYLVISDICWTVGFENVGDLTAY